MNSQEFRKAAHQAVEESTSVHFPCIIKLRTRPNSPPIVIDYYETIEQRRVLSDVEPGYLAKLLPSGPPENGERWEDIQKDIERKIMPGLTHWCAITTLAKYNEPKLTKTIKELTKLYGIFPCQCNLPINAG